MDLSIYFKPIEIYKDQYKEGTIGERVLLNNPDIEFPNLENVNIAIIGVKEDRRALLNKGCAEAPDFVRGFLYQLYYGDFDLKIADLGNILPGSEIKDTYYALSEVISELVKRKIIPVIIGGSQDLTYANYLAYEKLEQTINLLSIDNKLDLGENGDEINPESFLSKIILHQPNYLFNYANLGYQTYFENQKSIDLLSKLHFDAIRLGEVVSNIEETEPVIRNADFVSVDVSCIRQSDAPGNVNAGPNGFYGEQACQLASYAGISDKLSSIGFYEINPQLDRGGQTSHLVAQMIWCFIEAFYQRKSEYPINLKKGYLKYLVTLEDEKENNELVFYKSKRTDRWWMDIPYPPNKGMKYERHHLLPCSYNDYQTACKGEIPDRWWKTYQKLI